MTVKELVDVLLDLPQEAMVLRAPEEGEGGNFIEVTEARLLEACMDKWFRIDTAGKNHESTFPAVEIH